MLIQFRFKNFKSFHDDTILDLSATDLKDFSERVVKIGKEKILPIAAIYGANASGKTNVYEAFEYMSLYVLKSFLLGDEEESEFNNKFRVTPFLFDDLTAEMETTFEVYFTIPNDEKGKVYNYGFSIFKDTVIDEWLKIKAKTSKNFKTIFIRNNEMIDLTGLPVRNRENIKTALEKEVLIISLGAKLKVDICKIVRDWFFMNECANFGNMATNFFLLHRLPENFDYDINVQDKVVHYLSTFDKGIRKFNVEKINIEDESDEEKFKVSTLHKKINSEDLVELPFNNESAGTLKMFALYPDLQDVLKKGSIFFIDELNARLHPLLVRNFILTFLNPEINVNHAQLIFTTHDTWQLSTNLLRKDEIWFVDKDDNGISSLYSLVDFITEKTNEKLQQNNYENDYLLGKFGAIPFLKKIKIN